MTRLPVLTWLLLLLGAAAVVITAPPAKDDLAQFLPDAVTLEQQLLLDEIRQGPGARLIMLELAGGTSERLAQASTSLAATLQRSGHFERVVNGAASMDGELSRPLFDHRYLLASTSPDNFSTDGLKRALAVRLRELSSPVGLPDKHLLPADPTATFRSLINRWRHNSGPEHRHGVWFSRDGSSALLMVESRYPGFDLERQEQAVSFIHDAFNELAGSATLTLRVTGAPAYAVQSRRGIQREVTMLSLLATCGLALILLSVFRSLRLVLLAALPLASSILVGAAAVIVGFGQIHAIALAFGIILIGVSVDYPIHLFTHAGGKDMTRSAVATVWPVLRIGLITTTLGFSALLFTNFSGLAQLGTFAVAGLLVAAGVTRFVLALLISRVRAKSALEPLATALFLRLRMPWLPLGIIGLALVVLASRSEHLWEHDLARLSPLSAEVKAMDTHIRQELGAPDAGRLLLMTGESPEQVLQLSEALEVGLSQQVAVGNLAGFDLPSRYLPSLRSQQSNRDALPDAAGLRENLAQALEGLPFKPGLFEPFIRDVARSKLAPGLTPDEIAKTPLGLRLSSLLGQRGDAWVGLGSLSGIKDEAPLRRLVADSGEGVFYLDLPKESSQLVADYRDETLRLSALAAAIILLVLFASLGEVRLLARVAAPVAAAVLGTVAVLSLLGQQLSVFHIAALLMVIGIGIDYALFIVRTPANHPRFPSTAGSLLLCNLSTLLVFGLLACSSVPVLFAIGITVFSGTLLSLVFSAAMVRSEAPDARRPEL
jgi:predicted exporter